ESAAMDPELDEQLQRRAVTAKPQFTAGTITMTFDYATKSIYALTCRSGATIKKNQYGSKGAAMKSMGSDTELSPHFPGQSSFHSAS
ncbi:MAG: hypothetical protein L0099_13525, partial [Acidobacteria bacterium]|nr:hypothetical protein [Acidobacteriota bacterium]